MKTYPKYKKSGIDWIGEIPEEWDVGRLKNKVLIKYGCSLAEMDRADGEVDVYGSNGVVGRHNKSITKEETIIIGRKGSNGRINYSKQSCFPIDTSYFIDKRCTQLNLRYLFYLLSLLRLDEDSMDSAVPGLNRDMAYNKIVPYVESKQQTKISIYLDHELDELDVLINKDKKLIDLLKEKRVALIDRAVTKGLYSNVELKDSGVDWIGQVPVTWVVKKLKFVARIKTGDKNTEDQLPDGKYSFFVRSQTIERLDTFTFNGEAVLTAGDGVGVGKVFHYYNGKFDYHQRVYGITHFKEVFGKYAFYYLKNNLIKEMLKYNAKSTVDSLRLPMFLNFVMTFPKDVEEQKAIVEYLDKATSKIDTTINKIESKINLLEEYKKSLIHHVVTGKVDVRGIEI